LLAGRAALVDGELRDVWRRWRCRNCALAAVGGYGRGQLYPGSDVDLLILVPDAEHAAEDPAGRSGSNN
jgi:[protein-PII] uridylyltransferase